MMKLERLAVSCGGTGGHFYPGLSVARELNAAGGRALLILGGKNAPGQAEIARGFGVQTLQVAALPLSKNPLKLFRFLLAFLRGRCQCIRAFREFKPQALLCMGSFASLPPAMAAKSMKIPLFLHDGNARLGKANKFLSRYAKALGLSFPSPDSAQCRCPVIHTGMPLRHELLAGKMEKAAAMEEINRRWNVDFKADAPTLLVFGGSLGASSINRTSRISKTLPGGETIQLIHLAGVGKLEELERYYEGSGGRKLLLESSPDMHLFYSAADMIICRAGGSTVTELAYFGKYAIVVPYPYAAENHQMDNAMWLASSGGARIVKDSDCTEENFNRIVLDWLREPDKYREMGAKLAEIAIPDASHRILNMIGNIVFVARAV